MRQLLEKVHSCEEGHMGAALASLLAIAATVVLAIGLTGSSDAVRVAGAVLMGLAVLVSVNAPHEWLKRVYKRLDRISPEDPDAKLEGMKIEF